MAPKPSTKGKVKPRPKLKGGGAPIPAPTTKVKLKPKGMKAAARARGLIGIGRGQYKTKKGKVFTWHGSTNSFAKAKYRTTQPTVPPGLYDPALDAQGRAATRGLSDLRQDTSLGSTRSLEDYKLAQGDLTRSRDEGLQDILTSGIRGQQDFTLAGQREGADYQTAVGGLHRQYGILAQQQAESQRTANVDEGGAGLQAQAKRQANMAIEQQPIDTSHARSVQDLNTSFARSNQDLGLSRDRLVAGTDRSLGRLGVGYQRGETDRNTALTRAVRENRFFGSDLTAQKVYQAKGTGYVPPKATRTLIRPPLPAKRPVTANVPLPKGPKRPKIYDPGARPGKVKPRRSRMVGGLL